MTNAKTMIKVDHISKYFGPLKALNDVSLELHKGEIVVLIRFDRTFRIGEIDPDSRY